MKEKIKQTISTIINAVKTYCGSVKPYCITLYNFISTVSRATYTYGKLISKTIFAAMFWIYNTIADLFRKVPAELTYWHDGTQNMVEVDDFVELAPNMIQYEDTLTKKRVKVKAEYPIKYILKEK
jgi:hypothetical protein